MKKISIVAAAMIAASASAGPSFNLAGGAFGLWIGLNGDNPLPVGSIVHLIWSADLTASDNTVWDSAGYLAQGDYLLFQGSSADFLNDQGAVPPFAAGGGWTGDLDGSAVYNNANVGSQNIFNGYVYGRVFNSTDVNLGGGIVFGQTSLVDVDVSNESTNIPPGIPQTVDFGGINSAYDDDVLPDGFDGGAAIVMGQGNVYTTVPEPSVFAFIGIGAAMLGLRRKISRS